MCGLEFANKTGEVGECTSNVQKGAEGRQEWEGDHTKVSIVVGPIEFTR